MRPKTHIIGKSGKYRGGLLLLCLLAAFVWARPANAQTCPPGGCSSYIEQMFKDGKDLLWQAGDVIWKGITSIQLGAIPATITANTLAALSYHADLHTYQAAQDDRRRFGDDSADGVDKMMSSTETSCHTQQQAEGRNLAAVATPAVAGGMAVSSINHSQQGTGAPVLSSQLALDISHGFRDCSSSGAYGSLLQQLCSNGATTTVNNESFLNADVLLTSLLGYDQYNVPANTTVSSTNVSGGNAKLQDLTLPTVQQLSSGNLGNAEEHFIAAYYYCQRWKPRMPMPPSGNNRQMTSNDPVVLEQQLDLVAKSDGPFEICLGALTRRTAVSQAVAQKLGGQWQNMYNAQLQICTQMHNMGMLSDCLFNGSNCQSTSGSSGAIPPSNCTTNGISQVALDRATAYRFAQANYLTYLVGHQHVTPAELMKMQQTEQYVAIQNFENALTMEKIGVATALNGAMTLPTAPGSNPTAQGVGN